MAAPELHERLYSPEEFWEISQQPEYTEKNIELINGVIVEMSRPGGGHGKCAALFARFLGNYASETQLGEVGVENGYVMVNGNVRGPDVSFVSYQTQSEGIPNEGYASFAPDLAVEVVSPNDHAEDVQDKVIDYLHSGTKLVLVVYLNSKTINAYSIHGLRIYQVGDVFDGGEILPGFKLAVRDIFP
jgi:Uma2 family endonuclease